MNGPLYPNTHRKLLGALRLLSSDQTGDVVAAAAAVTRIAKSFDRDWLDLLRLPAHPAPEPEALEIEFQRQIQTCCERLGLLTERERSFIANIARKPATALSQKQLAWLARIAEAVLDRCAA